MQQGVKVVTLKATYHRTDTPELIASGGVLRTEHWCLSCIHPKMNFAGSPFNSNKLGLAAITRFTAVRPSNLFKII